VQYRKLEYFERNFWPLFNIKELYEHFTYTLLY
jgi:hypothetical protein